MMLRWLDIIRLANNGNPIPDKRVEKIPAEWKSLLTAEQFAITRLRGTEPAFSSELCSYFEPGKYACVCCGTELFDTDEKFESGTGWPSFTQPVKENVVAYHKDSAFGMKRIEAKCNICDAHLGHAFPDGPSPAGLRYCINALSLKKLTTTEKKIDFGGGCFWCTEAIFQEVKGVLKVVSGYSGGTVINPTYREVCSGQTGHAEMVEITYNPAEISFDDLLRIHLSTHNPTTVDKQGEDSGSQYRSVIFYRTEEEKQAAMRIIDEVQHSYPYRIITQLHRFEHFFKAEDVHQDYYNRNQEAGYCQLVINPKLSKFRDLYRDKLQQ
jgi:peptide methionine sulfoxide reductase msrA/msrB